MSSNTVFFSYFFISFLCLFLCYHDNVWGWRDCFIDLRDILPSYIYLQQEREKEQVWTLVSVAIGSRTYFLFQIKQFLFLPFQLFLYCFLSTKRKKAHRFPHTKSPSNIFPTLSTCDLQTKSTCNLQVQTLFFFDNKGKNKQICSCLKGTL